MQVLNSLMWCDIAEETLPKMVVFMLEVSSVENAKSASRKFGTVSWCVIENTPGGGGGGALYCSKDTSALWWRHFYDNTTTSSISVTTQ